VSIFLFILLNNIAPVFLLIFLGFLMGRKFKLDVYSFSKINLYIYVPALVFVKLYETKIEAQHLQALLYAVLYLAALTAFAMLISKLRKHPKPMGNAFKNSIMFYNSGNFGLPLVTLVFKDSPYLAYAVSIQIMVLLLQDLSTNTIGFFNAGRGKMTVLGSIKYILKMPAVYAITAAALLKCIPFDFTTTFVWPAAVYIKDGLISIALLTLGIQLSRSTFAFKNIEVYLASFIRLLGGPALALLVIYCMGIHGEMARVLFISSSVPTAVNTALIAVELDNEKDFASQVVMTATLLSAVTLTVIIYLSTIIFKV
jgi:malate permease and related proteins